MDAGLASVPEGADAHGGGVLSAPRHQVTLFFPGLAVGFAVAIRALPTA